MDDPLSRTETSPFEESPYPLGADRFVDGQETGEAGADASAGADHPLGTDRFGGAWLTDLGPGSAR